MPTAVTNSVLEFRTLNRVFELLAGCPNNVPQQCLFEKYKGFGPGVTIEKELFAL